MTDGDRFGLALFLAPLSIPALPFLERAIFSPREFDPVGDMMIGYLMFFSYVEFVVLGVPTIFLLRHFGQLTLANLVITGFLLGSTLGQILPFLFFGQLQVSTLDNPAFLAGFGLLGLIVAMTFGLIAGVRFR